MKYYARIEDKFMWASDGRNFSFDANACVGSRDGQDDTFLALFDRFPAGATNLSYDEDSNIGGYCIDGGEEVTEAGDLRCIGLKEVHDLQVDLVDNADNGYE